MLASFFNIMTGLAPSYVPPVPPEPIVCSIGGGATGVPQSQQVTSRNIRVTGATSGGIIWGSNPYTEDSNYNMAAVHAGLVSVGETATVTLFSPGQYYQTPGYTGTTRNGVTSQPWYTPWCGFYMRRSAAGVLNGIASATDLISYFGPAPGRGFRFTSTGLDQVLVDQIPYVERGVNGMNHNHTNDPSTKYTGAGQSYPAGNLSFAGGVDDGWYTVPVGWNVNFLGRTYNTIYPGTNMYITFGGGSAQYAGLSYSQPPYPKIMMSCGDHSCQTFFYGYIGNTVGSRILFIRLEGVNTLHYGSSDAAHNYPQGPYSSGQGPMVYEAYFYENQPNVIEFHVMANYMWV